MKNTTKTFLAILAGLFALLQVVALFSVARAVRGVNVSAIGGGAQVNEEYLAVRIGEELAKAQDRLLLDCGVAGVRDPDPEDMTCEFLIEAVPARFAAGAAASLTIEGEAIALRFEEGALRGAIRRPLGWVMDAYRVTFTEGGQVRNQEGFTKTSTVAWAFFPGREAVWEVDWPQDAPGGALNFEGSAFAVDAARLPFGDGFAAGRVFAGDGETELFSFPLENDGSAAAPAEAQVVPGEMGLHGEITGESGMRYVYQLHMRHYNQVPYTLEVIGLDGSAYVLKYNYNTETEQYELSME